MDTSDITEGVTSCPQDKRGLLSAIESADVDQALELLNGDRAFPQNELDNALILTCQLGHKYLVYELVHHGANIETKDTTGNSPLMICARNGFIDMARFFIRRKADINATNNCGDNVLILSLRPVGSVEIVKLLLQQTGVDINHQNRDGYTALMKAIEAMDVDVIKLLLDEQDNAEVVLEETKNNRDETAQQIADQLGLGNVVRLLSKHKDKPTRLLQAAIEACDLDSVNIFIDSKFLDKYCKETNINSVFQDIFIQHQKNRQTFNEVEVNILELLLKYGANIRDVYDNTVIAAVEVGSYRVVELLCERVSKTELKAHYQRNDPLKMAAEIDRADIIELLLKYQVNINGTYFSNSPLDAALRHGHIDCARLLIRHGATMDIESALRSAVSNQLVVYLKFLLENFPSEVRRIASTKFMNNLLVSAAEAGNLEIIGLLIDAGANVNRVSTSHKSPLMESCNAAVVHFLVQRGAVVNKWRALKGCRAVTNSPLTYILSCERLRYDSSRRKEIVQALLEHGAVIGESCSGRTPLMMAASQSDSCRILQMLLEHGANVRASDNEGNTALLIAAERNCLEYITILLPYTKHIINVQNDNGYTALMFASKHHNLLAVKELIDYGAAINIRDMYGNTALLLALIKTSVNENEILATLLNAGSDINYQNNSGFSPLMMAARWGTTVTLSYLVKSGADVNAISSNINNGTVLSYLLRERLFESSTPACVQYLINQGAVVSYANPDAIHRSILQREIQLIPQLIQWGLGPADVDPRPLGPLIHVASLVSVSPLFLALLKGDILLARYFVENVYLTRSDVSSLLCGRDQRLILEMNKQQKSLDLLQELSAQPMSLFNLALVAVQSAVGTRPGREERLNILALPEKVKDRLLFRTKSIYQDIAPVDKSKSERGALFDLFSARNSWY